MQNNTTEPKPNVAEQGFPLNACVHLYGCCARRRLCLDGVGALGEPWEAGAVGFAGWAPCVAVRHGGGKLLGALGDPGELRGGSGGFWGALGGSGGLWGSSGGALGELRGTSGRLEELGGAREDSGEVSGVPGTSGVLQRGSWSSGSSDWSVAKNTMGKFCCNYFLTI